MEQFFEFIDKSVTAFHAVNEVKKCLNENGFNEVFESEDWSLLKGGKYYTVRNSSSIIAFVVPEEIKGFHIFAAHTDSPSFRIKENAEVAFEDKYVRLNVEKYGGMIYSSWFDRPLSLAGRVISKDKDELKESLVNIDKNLLTIPNLAIHMNRKINEGMEYSVQNDLLPLFSDESGKGRFLRLIAESIGAGEEDILSYDLFLYPREKATYIGLSDEFIQSPRLDDLASVYAGLSGFINSEGVEYCNVLALFDNEEVGSLTKQGADSTFLYDVLTRITEELSLTNKDYLKFVSKSFLVSADNGHAVHPAYQGKACVTNRPGLNKGIVLKYNGNQKYATDAVSSAYFKDICNKNGIKYQTYANNSDIAGGSTLGNISTAHISLNTVDIGLPQLAMHSAVETMGSEDIKELISFVKAFYSK